MDDPRKIILEPLLTEKSTHLTERVNKQGRAQNAYCFKVAPGASKIEIRQAVEAIFNVEVLAVNTLWRHGKTRRNRRGGQAHLSGWKKAIVTLNEGHRIELH